jgi:hydrogenase maturation protease
LVQTSNNKTILSEKMKNTLIYGYGNPGRQDDGLGARFTELCETWVQKNNLQNITIDCNYQLNVEDAAMIAEFERVVFVDASVVDEVENYKLETIQPDNATIEFTMHAVSVGYVVDLCQKIYGKTPQAYVLHIKAYEFDFKEELTQKAETNMLAAFDFLKGFLLEETAI